MFIDDPITVKHNRLWKNDRLIGSSSSYLHKNLYHKHLAFYKKIKNSKWQKKFFKKTALQVYVPQNSTQFSIIHILCHKHISWTIIGFLERFSL